MTAETPIKRGRGRPRKNPISSAGRDDDLIGGGAPTGLRNDGPALDGLDLGLVYAGVSAHWLAHVFGMDKNTVKKKLARCEVAGKNGQTPLYRIKDAAAWLIPPKVDIMTYIKGLRAQDLPPVLNDAYWSAMIKRQKWEENAGDLWRTNDVLSVFGSAALRIKSTVQLWVDELDRVVGITDEQRVMLSQLSDGLLEEVHDIFVTSPSKGETRSTITQHDEEPERDELI